MEKSFVRRCFLGCFYFVIKLVKFLLNTFSTIQDV